MDVLLTLAVRRHQHRSRHAPAPDQSLVVTASRAQEEAGATPARCPRRRSLERSIQRRSLAELLSRSATCSVRSGIGQIKSRVAIERVFRCVNRTSADFSSRPVSEHPRDSLARSNPFAHLASTTTKLWHSAAGHPVASEPSLSARSHGAPRSSGSRRVPSCRHVQEEEVRGRTRRPE
jgi:hypothetical protein